MWWKKVLYFLFITILGIGITTLISSIVFINLTGSVIEEHVQEQKYTLVESFFNYVTPNDDEKFLIGDKDGTHYEVLPCLVKQPYYKDYGSGEYVFAYDIVEEAIEFSFFNLPSEFMLEEKETIPYLLLSLSNNKDYKLYLDNTSFDPIATNYNINFAKYIDEFRALYVYITYDDFIKYCGTSETEFIKFKLIDGNNNSYFEFEFTNRPSFSCSMLSMYYDACHNYREYLLKYGDARSVTAFERKDELLQKINQITTNNLDRFNEKPSKAVVIFDTRFILAFSLSISLYVSAAVVVSKILISKQKI